MKRVLILLVVLLALPLVFSDMGGNGNGGDDAVCVQVITPAVNKAGACIEYPTPCDVPGGWEKVGSCAPYAKPALYDDENEADDDGPRIFSREERIEKMKEIGEKIKDRLRERTEDLREKGKEIRERMQEELQGRILEIRIGEQKEIADGFFIKLESVDYNNCMPDANKGCPAVQASAAITVTVPDKNFTQEAILEGNKRENIAGAALKLISVKSDSARIQVLPLRALIPHAIGSGSISIVPNVGRIMKEIDDTIESAEIDDLNSLSREEIKNLIINPARAEIRAEIKTEAGKIMKSIPKMAMHEINARIRTQGRIADINIVQNDNNEWVIQTPKGNIPVRTEVELDGNNLYIITPKLKKRLNVLPEEASDMAKLKANMHLVKAVQMETENGEPVYKIKGVQKGKILGLFPTTLNVDADVDIDSGNVKVRGKPWWSFLVFPDK